MDRSWRQLAEVQLGLITCGQLGRCGVTRRQIRSCIERGELECRYQGLYRVVGSERTWHQNLMEASLIGGPGSALSHRSAAALWHLDGFEPGFVELTSSRKLRHAPCGVHRGRVEPEDASLRRHMRLTNPTRTLLDLAAVVDIAVLERAYESALRRKLTHPELLLARFLERARSGRNGVTRWRQLLEARGLHVRPTDSNFETIMVQLLRTYDLPAGERQHEIFDGSERVRRVDLAYPELKIALEADGAQWHLGREAWQKDLATNNRLASMGWIVLRFTWDEVVNHPNRVAETIRRVLSARMVA